jgi:hypothetical protein
MVRGGKRHRSVRPGAEAGGIRRQNVLVAVLLGLAVALTAVGLLARARGGGDGTVAQPAARAAPDRQLARRRVAITWVGDTMFGSAAEGKAPPRHGRGLFAAVAGRLGAADITAANLEGTLTTATTSKCAVPRTTSCFAFRADPADAGTLGAAGIDIVNLANNHAWDYGALGQSDTIAALDAAGVRWTGTPGTVTVIERNGVRVGFVGYAPYPWAPTLADVPLAQGLVRFARTRADVVVAFIHAGREGRDATHTPVGEEVAYGEDRGDTRGFAHALVQAGADLVLGSGPHVVRGLERYQGSLIAYSLGNFAGWHNFATGGTYDLSGMLTVRLDGTGHVVGGRWRSLRLVAPGIPQPDPTDASAHLVADVSRADFGAARWPLGHDGRLAAGER